MSTEPAPQMVAQDQQGDTTAEPATSLRDDIVAPVLPPQVPDQPLPVAPADAPPAVPASTPAPVPASAVVDTNNPDYYERPISLQFFAQTNAWRTDKDGHRVNATELMGGFVYKMALAGRYADRESRYRTAFDEFCQS